LDRTFIGWIAPACGWRTYSITSSALASSEAGIVSPSAFAVFKIDNHFKLDRLLNRHVGSSLTATKTIGVAAAAD
jgi:hypothetical protein